jgi:hypothetical protein
MPRFFSSSIQSGGGALVFAGGDRAGQLHRAAVKQQLFRQRGLARVRMRDDGERAPLLNFFRDVHKGENDNKKSGKKRPAAKKKKK